MLKVVGSLRTTIEGGKENVTLKLTSTLLIHVTNMYLFLYLTYPFTVEGS